MFAGLVFLGALAPALAVELSGQLMGSPTLKYTATGGHYPALSGDGPDVARTWLSTPTPAWPDSWLTSKGTQLTLDATSLPIDAYVDLDFGSAAAPFRADGSFSFGEVKPGQHIVRPMVRGYAMTDLMVTVPTDDAPPHVQAFIPGKQALPVSTATLGFPLMVGAMYAQTFFTEANSMNILEMLKSPMVLMMLASGVLAFVVPKMTAGMDDPELAAEMAAQRKRMTAASQMDWTGALASRLAGEKQPSDAPARTASPSAAPAGAAGTSSPGPAARTPARGGASGAKRGGKRR